MEYFEFCHSDRLQERKSNVCQGCMLSGMIRFSKICPESSLVLKSMKFENVKICSVAELKALLSVLSHYAHALLPLLDQYA